MAAKGVALVADNVVVIRPFRNMTVPVILELQDAEPAIDLPGYDHAVGCSVDLSTGELQVSRDTVGGGKLMALPPQWHKPLCRRRDS